MNYENFYNLIRTGVFNELPTVPFKGANQDGLYLGRPGIDIYDMLPLLTEYQMDQIANELANSYPSIPPLDHVGYALCMRLVYGKMDKNGAIRNPSNVDLSRWKLADVFLGKLMRYFVINKNIYGQCVYHEMFAHRLADLSIYYCHDRIVLNEALESYRLCSALATKCLSYKHIFSSIYWGSEYLNRCGDKRCVDWAIESLQLMDKYCPSKRYGYKAKAYAAMQIIFRMDSKKWRKILKFK